MKNKCENCSTVCDLRQRYIEQKREIESFKKAKDELESKVRYYELNSVPISLEEKYVFWDRWQKRLVAEQEAKEKERDKEIEELLNDLGD